MLIETPYQGNNFTSNIKSQTFTGYVPPDTTDLYFNNELIPFDPTTKAWEKVVSLINGDNTFNVVARNGNTIVLSATQLIYFEDSAESSQFPGVAYPTGLFTKSNKDTIEIALKTPPIDSSAFSLVGVTFYYSTEAGGGLNGYNKLNDSPIGMPTGVESDATTFNTQILSTKTEGSIEITSKLVQESKSYYNIYSYKHTATSPVPLDLTKPAYYVATYTLYSSDFGLEFETYYSAEIYASPVIIDTTIRDLPPRNKTDVAMDYIRYLLTNDPNIDLAPGTTTREQTIDPFSNEVERERIIADFNSRCQSFLTLVGIDDPNNTGESDPVANNEYKTKLKSAFGNISDTDVQNLIDAAFDKLSGNYGQARFSNQVATGEVVLYTTELADMQVNIGSQFATDSINGSVYYYQSTATYIVRQQQLPAYYNSATKRYEIVIPVEAVSPGSNYNVPPGSITQIKSGTINALGVINDKPITGGFERESNTSLASRSLYALVGVDSGTKGGYILKSLSVPGVRSVKVVGAGDYQMVRDYDTVRKRHAYGMVDLYIQGQSYFDNEETFSFSYPEVQEELGLVVSANLYQIKVTNTDVSKATPLFKIEKVVNSTRGHLEYDLTGLTILDSMGNVFALALNATNTTIGICDTDIIRVTYSYVKTGEHVFKFQPILNVVDVTGELSGDLNDNYNIIRGGSILYEGNSTRAGDKIELFRLNGKPLDQLQSIEESQTFVSELPVVLNKVGVIIKSIIVMSSDKSVIYTKDVDYRIEDEGSNILAPTLSRISSGAIEDNETVIITYECGENIKVKYSYNRVMANLSQKILGDADNNINGTRHIDADVLIKELAYSGIDIDMLVYLKKGIDVRSADKLIRDNVSKFFSTLGAGQSVNQSDIIAIVDDTRGVDKVAIPLRRMTRGNNNLIVMEAIPDVTWEIYSENVVTSYRTPINTLKFKTLDKGGRDLKISDNGYDKRYTGVAEDTIVLTHVESKLDVAKGAGRCYICDDGSVIVSTVDGKSPSLHSYLTTYYVYGEEGAYDIQADPVEILTLGRFNVLYSGKQSL